jgi:PLP dependent protein
MLRELSMGMSQDFEVAIAEGATIVRVGTAIFGSRHAG